MFSPASPLSCFKLNRFKKGAGQASMRGYPQLLRSRAFHMLGLMLLLLFGYWHYVVLPLRGQLLDFSIYLEAAQRFARGETVYGEGYARISALGGQPLQMFYLYPPVLMAVLSDFLFIPERALRVLWCWLNYLALLAAAGFIIAALRNTLLGRLSWPERAVLALILLFCFEPVFAGALEGQANALVVLLLGIFIYGLAQNRGLTAGLALCAATAIKITPILLLLVALLKGGRRIFAGFATGALVIAAYLFLKGISWAMFTGFFARLILLNAGEAPTGAFNFSSPAALLRPLGLETVAAARLLWMTAMLLGALWAMRRWDRTSQLCELRAAAFLICIMTMFSPLAWYHHFAWLIIPLAVVSLKEQPDQASRLRLWTLSLGLYLLISKSFLIATYAVLSGSLVLTRLSFLLPTLCMGVLLWLLWPGSPPLDVSTGLRTEEHPH